MLKLIKPDTRRWEHLEALNELTPRTTSTDSSRYCSVCGKIASARYFHESEGKWVYRHLNRFGRPTLHMGEV